MLAGICHLRSNPSAARRGGLNLKRMSLAKNKMSYSAAIKIALPLVKTIEPYCTRVEIAGSLRRKNEYDDGDTYMVSDIEICCIPRILSTVDLFESVISEKSALESPESPTRRMGNLLKDGEKYKQIALPEGIKLDLFIVTPPAQWGVIFAIRTGPANYSRWLVTERPYGAMPPGFKVCDGCLHHNGKVIYTPEERDFFKEIGLTYLAPSVRQMP